MSSLACLNLKNVDFGLPVCGDVGNFFRQNFAHTLIMMPTNDSMLKKEFSQTFIFSVIPLT